MGLGPKMDQDKENETFGVPCSLTVAASQSYSHNKKTCEAKSALTLYINAQLAQKYQCLPLNINYPSGILSQRKNSSLLRITYPIIALEIGESPLKTPSSSGKRDSRTSEPKWHSDVIFW